MLNKTASVAAHLTSDKSSLAQDLYEIVIPLVTELELQVNVAQMGGELLDGSTSCYTDGIDKWSHFRIPDYKSGVPEFRDYQLKWPLHKYVDAIGSNGHNWAKQESMWIAFEFDSAIGHLVGLSPAKLEEIRQALIACPYVMLRRSTGGLGWHVYVFLPAGIKTTNRHEHAAVARAVLAQLSKDIGVDLQLDVDVCGGNMWFWARRASPEKRSFELVKKNELIYPHDLNNWRDHLPRLQTNTVALPTGEDDIWARLSSAHIRHPMTPEHQRIIEGMSKYGTTIWNDQHGILHTHTVAALRAHEELGLKGVYDTSSPGSKLSMPNCYGYMGPNGTIKFFRFGNPPEADNWTRGEKTWCWYNKQAPLADVCVQAGGVAQGKSFEFARAERFTKMVADQYPDTELPAIPPTARCTLKATAIADTFLLEVKSPEALPGFDPAKKNGWQECVIKFKGLPEEEPLTTPDMHLQFRRLETEARGHVGWAVESPENPGIFHKMPPGEIIGCLMARYGVCKDAAMLMKGELAQAPYKLVSLPFAKEYPAYKTWNDSAPQLAHKPIEGYHPTWDLVLSHLGQGLTDQIKVDKIPHVHDGATYLKAWWACILRKPTCRLPYLFFYGPPGGGKSTFSNAFKLLVTKGVVRAEKLLKENYNAALDGCVLAVIDDDEVTKKQLENLKSIITEDTLSIRRMYTDSFEVKNHSHWCHYSNHLTDAPIFHGDRRITAAYVPLLEKGETISKVEMMAQLTEEAPYFLHALMTMKLPAESTSFALPVVDSEDRKAIMNAHASDALTWLMDHTILDCKSSIPLEELRIKIQADYSVSRGEIKEAVEQFQGRVMKKGKVLFARGIKLKGAI